MGRGAEQEMPPLPAPFGPHRLRAKRRSSLLAGSALTGSPPQRGTAWLSTDCVGAETVEQRSGRQKSLLALQITLATQINALLCNNDRKEIFYLVSGFNIT